MDRLVSRAFSATLVRDGITYEVVLSVESLRIAAGATSGSLTFKASAYRRVGDGARAAYSCYFAAFKRTGTSHATGVRTTSKATSWNRTSAISVASTVNAVVVYISDSQIPTTAFTTEPSFTYLAKMEIKVVKDGDPGGDGYPGKDAQYIYLRGVNFWHHQSGIYRMVSVSGGANLIGASLGIGLTIINRSTLAHVESVIYNTYSYDSDKTSLIDKLDTLDDTVFVCLTSGDAISFSDALIAKLKTFGLASFEYTTSQQNARTPFAFIGYLGLPEGHGITRIYPSLETSPVAEISVYVANGVLSSMDGRSAIRLALDNQHEDFLYSDSNNNEPIAPSGGASSAIHLYDGDADIPLGLVDLSIDYSAGKTSGVPASGQTGAPGISNGVLTVPHITADTAKVVVKGKYPNNDSGKFYYADFTGNRVRQDKYDLILRPNALAYNPSNYASAAASDTIQTIIPSAERTDLKGNKTTGLTIQTSEVDGLRLYYSYVKTDGTLQTPSLIRLTTATFGVSKSVAGTYIGIYFELRLYSGTGYRMCDYETVEIAKSADGGIGPATPVYDIVFDTYSASFNVQTMKLSASFGLYVRKALASAAEYITSLIPEYSVDGANWTGTGSAVSSKYSASINDQNARQTVPNTIDFRVRDGSNNIYCTAAMPISIKGAQGDLGPFCYDAGEYSDQIEYTRTASLTLYVEVPINGSDESEVWVLNALSNVLQNGTHVHPHDSGQSVWRQGTNLNLLKTKYLFANFANLAKFLVSGDWILSQNGVIGSTVYSIEGATYGATSFPAYLFFDPVSPTVSDTNLNIAEEHFNNTSLEKKGAYFSLSVGKRIIRVTGFVSGSGSQVMTLALYKYNDPVPDPDDPESDYIKTITSSSVTTVEFVFDVDDDWKKAYYNIRARVNSTGYYGTIESVHKMSFVPNLALDGLTGKTYQIFAIVKGRIEATEGLIGGFSIGSNALTNTNYQAGISIKKYEDNQETQVVQIGKDAEYSMNGSTNLKCSMRAESKGAHSYNTALFLNAVGGTYNYAFHGNGNGVLDGLVFGFKTKQMSVTQVDQNLGDIPLVDGSTIIVVGNQDGNHSLMPPKLSAVRGCLGIPSSDTKPFSIEIDIINLTIGILQIFFRGYAGISSSEYPYLISNNGNAESGKNAVIHLTAGGYLKLRLIYYNDSKAYRAHRLIYNHE